MEAFEAFMRHVDAYLPPDPDVSRCLAAARLLTAEAKRLCVVEILSTKTHLDDLSIRNIAEFCCTE